MAGQLAIMTNQVFMCFSTYTLMTMAGRIISIAIHHWQGQKIESSILAKRSEEWHLKFLIYQILCIRIMIMCDLHMNHYGVGVKVSMCMPLP